MSAGVDLDVDSHDDMPRIAKRALFDFIMQALSGCFGSIPTLRPVHARELSASLPATPLPIMGRWITQAADVVTAFRSQKTRALITDAHDAAVRVPVVQVSPRRRKAAGPRFRVFMPVGLPCCLSVLRGTETGMQNTSFRLARWEVSVFNLKMREGSDMIESIFIVPR